MTGACARAARLTPFHRSGQYRYGHPTAGRGPSPCLPSGGGKETDTMPVPIPRQRAIPAAESGQAQAAVQGGPLKEEAHRNATTGGATAATLTLLLIEDDPAG